MPLRLLVPLLAFLVACPSANDDDTTSDPTDAPPLTTARVPVTVTLDGAPAPAATVMQGGLPDRWTTDAEGTATITVDLTLAAEHWVLASAPDARTGAAPVDPDAPAAPLTIALSRFDPSDNPAFVFRDPGEPDRRDTTAQCAHCHLTLNEDWIDSAHRHSASDPQVQDLYAGVSSALSSASACADAGGTWLSAPLPGGGTGDRCFLGEGTLQALNDCDGPCDDATAYGACADCHAPGIDGQLGGRDLRAAEGHAYEYGTHCDVCHRVESVDLTAPAGTAGALHMVRPSEPGAFAYPEYPLTFGPYDDVGSGVMGAVARDHFTDATLCAGCHQLDQEVLVPDAAIDLDRWPAGTLPIHSTYAEWLAGPLAPASPCQTCHMPPDEDAGNSADLTRLGLDPGLVAGWERPPGAVRHHAFEGPSTSDELLGLAAALTLDASVDGGTLTATATVRNVGAGHAIPTGEPLRSLLLVVDATCDGAPLSATSGFALPDIAGSLARKEAGEDWSLWPGAAPGMVVRVVSRPGGVHDDEGFGPFGDGTFAPEDKGMPVETVVASATIVSMDGDVATFDIPLPAGDVAWLGHPEDDAETDAAPLAGAPGHAFARVLVGPDGARHVPHFLAVDVASDNRLLPTASWSGTWTFDAPCDAPLTRARLLYRPWPLALAAERGWPMRDVLMEEATR